MHIHPLGNSPLSVAPLAFGGNVFGWSADEKRSFELLDAFVDAGGNLIDTADVYSAWVPGNAGGESETIIGKWLRKSGKRDRVVISTKVAKWAEHPGLSPVNIRQANQHMAMFSVDADAAQRLIDYSGLQVCRYLPGRAIVVLMLMHYIDGDLGQYYEFGTSSATLARIMRV